MQRSTKILAALTVTALALAGCAAGGSGGGEVTAGDPIKVGASLPLTGGLAAFGPIIQSGYEAAVADVNDAGGLVIDGVSHQVELVLLDNATDPNKVAEQARTLVLNDGVVGLLGSVTPGLTIPASNVADLEGVPMVSTLTPNGAWAAGNPDGWQYAWNLFMDEQQFSDIVFATADEADTNKKVVIFADTEEDGVATGGLWEAEAPGAGYEVVYRADNPAGTTDFTADINAAKAAGAEVLLAILIPPDAFALWEQMKALEYVPDLAFCLKCSSSAAFQAVLGDTAEATSNVYLANPSTAPEWADVSAEFEALYGENVDRSSALAAYSAARILLDSIQTAGSVDGAAVNAAIAATDKEYPIGLVKFREDHSYPADAATLQWFGATQLQVYPSDGEAELVTPVIGLQG
jgi:branched-chain amino acid transport system substrate-binding protein